MSSIFHLLWLFHLSRLIRFLQKVSNLREGTFPSQVFPACLNTGIMPFTSVHFSPSSCCFWSSFLRFLLFSSRSSLFRLIELWASSLLLASSEIIFTLGGRFKILAAALWLSYTICLSCSVGSLFSNNWDRKSELWKWASRIYCIGFKVYKMNTIEFIVSQ